MDVTLGLLIKDSNLPEVILIPMEEEDSLYTYTSTSEYQWQLEDCDSNVLQLTLKILAIPTTAPSILREMAELL